MIPSTMKHDKKITIAIGDDFRSLFNSKEWRKRKHTRKNGQSYFEEKNSQMVRNLEENGVGLERRYYRESDPTVTRKHKNFGKRKSAKMFFHSAGLQRNTEGTSATKDILK